MLRKLCNRQRKGRYFRKGPIKKSTWIVNKRKKDNESGQEHVNNKGKLVPAKNIVSKKDCAIKFKFNCTQKIDRETGEHIHGIL